MHRGHKFSSRVARVLAIIVAFSLFSSLWSAMPRVPAAIAQEGAPQAAPLLSRPANGLETTDTTPTFVWSRTDGAVAYRFELATDPSFSNVLIRVEDDRRSYAQNEPLPAGTTYSWRVGAVTADGAVTWSETWTFSIPGTAEPTNRPTEIGTEPPVSTQTPSESKTPTAVNTPESTIVASDIVSDLSGTLPATEGVKITGAGRSRSSTTSTTLVDRDLGTMWISPRTAPSSAFVYVRLDKSRQIGMIRWLFGETGHADSMTVQISTDRKTWTNVGTRTNATAGKWREIRLDARALFVRFYFKNPNGDEYLGGLAEVEIYTADQVATPVATGTATSSPTPDPAASSTPVTLPAASGGLIKNASFEQGDANWYLEGQNEIVSTDAHGGSKAMKLGQDGGFTDQMLKVTAGSTYVLKAWGKLDGGPNPGYVGVTFRDADGKRLSNLEPDMLEFTKNSYASKSLTFTVPAGVATITVFAWKKSGEAAFLVDDLSLVRKDAPVATPVPTASAGCQKLFAPAYFYPPTGQWDPLINNGTSLGIIILNPNSGVDVKHEWRYDEPLAAARAKGIQIIGYIQTDYGTRAASEVIREMDLYREWYGVTSFFLDEADTEPGSIPLYKKMTDYAHAMGGIVMLNFGYKPDRGYMAIADVSVVFEDSANVYANYSLPSWINEYPPSRFAQIVYGVSESNMKSVLQKTRASNVGYVWITDDHINTGSPYNLLPTYWDEVNAAAGSGC